MSYTSVFPITDGMINMFYPIIYVSLQPSSILMKMVRKAELLLAIVYIAMVRLSRKSHTLW